MDKMKLLLALVSVLLVASVMTNSILVKAQLLPPPSGVFDDLWNAIAELIELQVAGMVDDIESLEDIIGDLQDYADGLEATIAGQQGEIESLAARVTVLEGECVSSDEVCDGLDNDCDGEIDEDLIELCPLEVGVCEGGATQTCVSGTWSECDYGSYYEVEEATCDNLDNDCDGDVDEGVIPTFYADSDSDLYGDPESSLIQYCEAELGYVSDNTDCDDNNPDINPEATEVCDGLDNDCSGGTDDGSLCDDGKACTQDSCVSGTCYYPVGSGCLIDDFCWDDYQTHPTNFCQWCYPSESVTSWTTKPNGMSCGSGGTCQSGNCVIFSP